MTRLDQASVRCEKTAGTAEGYRAFCLGQTSEALQLVAELLTFTNDMQRTLLSSETS